MAGETLLLLGAEEAPVPPAADAALTPWGERTYTRVRCDVYASLTATTPLAQWLDVEAPQYAESIDGGAGQMSVYLPRLLGRADEPAEFGSTGSLALGNAVDVFVTSFHQRQPDVAVTANETKLFRGTIESYDLEGDGGVTVRLVPLTRLLAQSVITTAVTYTATSIIAIAKALVDGYAGGGVAWDSDNGTTGGISVTVTFELQTLDSALKALIGLGGVDYSYWVSAAGTVRFIKQEAGGESGSYAGKTYGPPANGTAKHALTLGHEVARARMTKESVGQIRKVHVVWNNAGTRAVATATAAQYDIADRREVLIATDLTDSGAATSRAASELARLNQIELRGQIDVLAERYPIETIRLGDVIQMHAPRDLADAAGFVGYNDYSAAQLLVAGISYRLAVITVDLQRRQPSVGETVLDAVNYLHKQAVYGVTGNTPAADSITAAKIAADAVGASELGVTAGTVTASKALVVDANKRADVLVIGALKLGAGAGTDVTATATELNVTAGVTPGTVAAGKAIVTNGSNQINGFVTTGGSTVGGTLTLSGNLDHDGSNWGMFGTAPATQQVVSGARGGNAALASLITALAAYGIIVDTTT